MADLPQVVATGPKSDIQKQIFRIRQNLINLIEDSVDVLHSAVIGEEYRGRKVTRTQLFAAQSTLRLAPKIDEEASSSVHFHLNIPRPKQIKNKVEIGENPDQS